MRRHHPDHLVLAVLLALLPAFARAAPLKLQRPARAPAPQVTVVRLPEGCLVPDVAVDGHGAVHLVYGRDHNAYYQRSSDDGRTFSKPVKVNSSGTVETEMGERGPKLALGRGGSVHVVWADDWQPGVKTYVRFARSVDGGQSFEARRTLSAMAGVDGVTLAADAQGNVAAFWHVMTAPEPAEPQATWLHEARSTDGGATFTPSRRAIPKGHTGLACSMCMMRARMDGKGRVLLAFRSAERSVRDFYLLEGSATGGPLTAHRVNEDNWVLPTCPMCGPELTRTPSGGLLVAFMSRHRAYWSLGEPEGGRFRVHAATPNGEEDEIYPSAVANRRGDVLFLWQVGPMATDSTATVKWALYSADGRFTGRQGTVGTSTSGTKATAFVGGDGGFRILTTAR